MAVTTGSVSREGNLHSLSVVYVTESADHVTCLICDNRFGYFITCRPCLHLFSMIESCNRHRCSLRVPLYPTVITVVMLNCGIKIRVYRMYMPIKCRT
jgi:hypothetical protein